jgi:hypothetical protein
MSDPQVILKSFESPDEVRDEDGSSSCASAAWSLAAQPTNQVGSAARPGIRALRDVDGTATRAATPSSDPSGRRAPPAAGMPQW